MLAATAMNTIEAQEQWLDVDQAAELTGYAFEHLRRLIRLGKLRAQKRQGRWFIARAELESYVDVVKQGRRPRPPTPMTPAGLRLWLPKPHSRTSARIHAIVNGSPFSFTRLDMEYPKTNDERLQDLAPGFAGFYTVSVRAVAPTVRWMEQQFLRAELSIIVPRNNISITYTKPVDYVCETVEPHFVGNMSAAFGFYKAHVELLHH